MTKRLAVFAYGVVSYAACLVVFLYAVGFVGNYFVPRSLDSAPRVPFTQAFMIDVLLLAAFALQHSVMARPGFKRILTRIIPEAAERSTYVLASSLAMIALFAWWQPIGGTVWNVTGPIARSAITGVYFMGFGLVLMATLLINHFDLFGLRQVWLPRQTPAASFSSPNRKRLRTYHPNNRLFTARRFRSWLATNRPSELQ